MSAKRVRFADQEMVDRWHAANELMDAEIEARALPPPTKPTQTLRIVHGCGVCGAAVPCRSRRVFADGVRVEDRAPCRHCQTRTYRDAAGVKHFLCGSLKCQLDLFLMRFQSGR